MADNVPITAGSGTNIATDDVGAVHYQRIKLVGGADGVATRLDVAEDDAHASGDLGIQVLAVRNDANAARSGTDGDYTPLSTDSRGNLNINARKEIVRAAVTSSGLTTATTAYVTGDQVGAQFTVAGAARASGGGGYITGVALIDAADIIGGYEVVFFDSSVTPAADNAAFAISDADALKIIGTVQLAGSVDIGNNRLCQAHNLAIPYVCSGGTSIYALLICRFGHTFFTAATDLQLVVYMEPS